MFGSAWENAKPRKNKCDSGILVGPKLVVLLTLCRVVPSMICERAVARAHGQKDLPWLAWLPCPAQKPSNPAVLCKTGPQTAAAAAAELEAAEEEGGRANKPLMGQSWQVQPFNSK